MHSDDTWFLFGAKLALSVFKGMTISVQREELARKSRFAHLALLNLNLRLMENWRSLQIASMGRALDCESTLILMAIIVISVEKLSRSALESDLQTLDNPLPQERIAKPNLSSIAAATGINRETVRRKVNELQEAGLVMREGRGVRTVGRGLPLKRLEECISTQLDVIARTVNALSKLGVFTTKRH